MLSCSVACSGLRFGFSHIRNSLFQYKVEVIADFEKSIWKGFLAAFNKLSQVSFKLLGKKTYYGYLIVGRLMANSTELIMNPSSATRRKSEGAGSYFLIIPGG